MDKAGAVDSGVQVTPRGRGPPLEEEVGLAGGGVGPSSGVENAGCGAGAAAPSLVRRGGDGSRAFLGSTDGGQVKDARVENEERRPWRPADRAPALKPPSDGPQVGRLCQLLPSLLLTFWVLPPLTRAVAQQPCEGGAAPSLLTR